MYKCSECEEVFETPKEDRFFLEYQGRLVSASEHSCPNCGHDVYEKLIECEYCGEFYDPKQSEISECCNECYWGAMETVNKAFDELSDLELLVKDNL